MNQQQWDTVDAYFTDRLVASDNALDATLAASAEAGLPSINVAPNQGKLLHLLAKIGGARRILEIGTLGGYSTLWLARALPDDGVLVSLEGNAAYATLARSNIEAAGLAAIVSIQVGDALHSLQQLVDAGTAPFDLVFIDADKENNPEYLRLSLQLSRPGTVIIADNVVRRGKVADRDDLDASAAGVRAYFDLLAGDPRLSSTAVQTVGSKGWDGFAITLVAEG
ncbi:MAG: O-methyltransferase [Pseudomonas sp.]